MNIRTKGPFIDQISRPSSLTISPCTTTVIHVPSGPHLRLYAHTTSLYTPGDAGTMSWPLYKVNLYKTWLDKEIDASYINEGYSGKATGNGHPSDVLPTCSTKVKRGQLNKGEERSSDLTK